MSRCHLVAFIDPAKPRTQPTPAALCIRKALEQLCRYIASPALENERVQTSAAGQVVLRLKTPWRDGTTHLVMSPLEFMQRHIDRQLCGIEFCER